MTNPDTKPTGCDIIVLGFILIVMFVAILWVSVK
jgi:hypothetical protein